MHVVEPGDTLWELAADNGCTVEQLRVANELGPAAPIVVGSRPSARRRSRRRCC
jgi:LysM repeat protein